MNIVLLLSGEKVVFGAVGFVNHFWNWLPGPSNCVLNLFCRDLCRIDRLGVHVGQAESVVLKNVTKQQAEA
jgi:hypothetical protein